MLVGCFILLSCQSTPDLDLSDTNLYLFPKRLNVADGFDTFKFDEKHRMKAIKSAKKLKLDILYEVYLNGDGTVRSAKKIKKTRRADNETVSKMRHQISKKGFFYSFGKDSAFFYGVKLTTEVEYL